ncbi:MAG TPA: DUF4124 domain-containing protein [Geobacteraceae bacterium]
MKKFMVFIVLALFAAPALAETYTWTDDQGVVNFADDLGSIPKKFRKKAKVVGEEEPPPAEVQEGSDKPAVQPQKGAGQEGREVAPAKKPAKKAMYGGKDATTWKNEFASARANLKAAEDQLTDNRNRLNDTSVMSRTDYLNIQSTIKSIETSVLRLRKQLDDLKKDAEAAGVPPELME